MNKKILITGGAGYIGSHILNQLKSADYQIFVYDNLSTGRLQSIVHGEFIEGDLGDQEKLESLFSKEKFDAVMHFAGSIIVSESVEKPLEYYQNNTVNSLNLISMCQKYDVNKFIFSSTAAVYGETKDGICSEETFKNPISPYGRSKLMTEWMLEDLARIKKDFRFVILRYFNVAGASLDGVVGQCSKVSTHLIKVASEVVSGKRDKMFVYGTDYPTEDGTCVRDYIHVQDLADAHIKSLSYLFGGGLSDTMNCGYGHGFSVNEVLETVKSVAGQNFSIELGERRYGDSAILVSKVDKIHDRIGWAPQFDDLPLIVKTALDWESFLQKEVSSFE